MPALNIGAKGRTVILNLNNLINSQIAKLKIVVSASADITRFSEKSPSKKLVKQRSLTSPKPINCFLAKKPKIIKLTKTHIKPCQRKN
jgi:hypothetical protein